MHTKLLLYLCLTIYTRDLIYESENAIHNLMFFWIFYGVNKHLPVSNTEDISRREPNISQVKKIHRKKKEIKTSKCKFPHKKILFRKRNLNKTLINDLKRIKKVITIVLLQAIQ